MATSVLSTTGSRKRRNPYTTIACDECKRRKVKCSGQKPCNGCQQGQTPCLYERSTRFRTDRRNSMVSSRSKDGNTEAATASDSLAAETIDVTPHDPTQHGAVGVNADSTAQPIRPGSSDYYLNLAQKMISTSSPEENWSHKTQSGHRPKLAHGLRQLIERCSGSSPSSSSANLPVSRWLEVLDVYEDEVGLLYPFLDVPELRNHLRDLSAHVPYGDPDRQEKRLERELEEVLILVFAVVAVLEDPAISTVCDPFARSLLSEAWCRSHAGNVSRHDVNLHILMSIYYFMTDREVLAWRNIGSVIRMLQELGYHNTANLQQHVRSKREIDRAKMVFWSAYMLDRRWSFGTGLPFAIQDSDIDYDVDFTDDSLPTSYLKAMVTYCRISAEVRDSALGTPSSNHAKDSARDLLDFKISQWRRNLPPCLQFHPGTEHNVTEDTRGQYRLRLLLYLRANQMKIIIHRKSALRSGSDAIDTSSINELTDVARETIHLLAVLTEASNIYHAQQKTFNHFLESALSALLLVSCHSKVEIKQSCFKDIHTAMNMIRRLAITSSITRKLGDKLRCFMTIGGEDEREQFGSASTGGNLPRSASSGNTMDQPVPEIQTARVPRTSRKTSNVPSNHINGSSWSSEHSQNMEPPSDSRMSPFGGISATDSNPTALGGYHGTLEAPVLYSTTPESLDQVASGPVAAVPPSRVTGMLGILSSDVPMFFPDGVNERIELPTDGSMDQFFSSIDDIWMDQDELFTF